MIKKRWRKANRSENGTGACVELAHTRDEIRDSKNPDGPTLAVPVEVLLESVKQDLPRA